MMTAMRNALAAVSVAAVALLAPHGEAHAQAGNSLTFDLSRDSIDIGAGFDGTRLLIYGAARGGGQVAVVVRGPTHTTTVQKKERMLGVWAAGEKRRIAGAPAYYWLATSAPLDKLAGKSVLKKHEIGATNLDIRAAKGEGKDMTGYVKGLARLYAKKGLYVTEPRDVQLRDDGLFRAHMDVPSNVPTGDYTVAVFRLKDGAVVDHAKAPLTVRKVGMEAEVYRLAHEHAAWYGIVALIIAVAAGWLAGAIFKKSK